MTGTVSASPCEACERKKRDASASFTPGPLVVLGRNKSTEIQGFTVIGTSKDYVATAYVAHRADALLYLAAPDMYRAAKLACLNFERAEASGNFLGDDEHESWTALAVAVAKAEGKS